MDGYIKLHRKMLENPVVCKDGDYLAVWIYLLLNATHKELPALFKGEKIFLKPGQLITGRKSIAEKLSISESKVTRIINAFISEQQIEQQTSNRNRLITVLNWNCYQGSEQRNEQPLNNKRTTSEQLVNTNKNVKNDKNVYKYIVEHLNKKAGTNYKHTSKATQKHINGRLSEGYTLEDFKIVIDKKVTEWANTDMSKFLRPETLFGTKFEGYLNQKNKSKSNKFNQFPQRTYTTQDYADIERRLINKGL